MRRPASVLAEAVLIGGGTERTPIPASPTHPPNQGPHHFTPPSIHARCEFAFNTCHCSSIRHSSHSPPANTQLALASSAPLRSPSPIDKPDTQAANSPPGGGLCLSVAQSLVLINKHNRHPSSPRSCDSLLSLSFSSCTNPSSPTRHRHCSSPSLAQQTACTRLGSRVAFQSTGKFHVCSTSLSHTTGVAEDKNAM